MPSFPRTSKYDPEWLKANAGGGANVLQLTEWLAEALDLRPGMRVLDLACGRAVSSIFLAREFGVQVWGVDLWYSATENLQRIRDAGVEREVFPLHGDARTLPFANEFFDAIVCLDAFMYFGTDDLYTNYITRFVKPGGPLAMAGAGLMREFDGPVPEHLRTWWEPGLCCLHSAAWWRQHWERSGLIAVERADTMPDGWQRWLEWHRLICPENVVEIDAVTADAGRWLGYTRVVGRRRPDAHPEEPITSVPTEYVQKPLLRE